MFFLQQFILGFFVESVASIGDTFSRIPIIDELTRGFKGKIAFALGTLIALSLILVIVLFFSFLIELIPYPNIIIAVLILFLALAVYFEVFLKRPERKLSQKISLDMISSSRFLKLVGIGFIVSFVTFLDDSIILSSIFVDGHNGEVFAVLGIYFAVLLQLGVVIYFGEKIKKIRYKKELASASLVILALLVLIGIV